MIHCGSHRARPDGFAGGSRRAGATAGGFTLIELVVTIGIIAALAGLAIAVSTRLVQKSEQRQTQTVLELLDQAVTEYEVTGDRTFVYLDQTDVAAGLDTDPPPDGFAYYDFLDANGPDTPVGANDDFELTHELIETLQRQENVASILRSMPDELLVQIQDDVADPGERHTTVVDPWGTQIIVVFPGRVPDADFPPVAGQDPLDKDGTIRTAFENRFGVAKARRTYFVSAGPDGLFGDLQLDSDPTTDPSDETLLRQADDNVYSYDVIREDPS